MHTAMETLTQSLKTVATQTMMNPLPCRPGAVTRPGVAADWAGAASQVVFVSGLDWSRVRPARNMVPSVKTTADAVKSSASG